MIEDFKNKIINADCLEILKKLPDNSVDLVLTDPPYLMDNHGGVVHTGSFKRKLTNEKHINFICDDFDFETVANEWVRVCKKSKFIYLLQ